MCVKRDGGQGGVGGEVTRTGFVRLIEVGLDLELCREREREKEREREREREIERERERERAMKMHRIIP